MKEMGNVQNENKKKKKSNFYSCKMEIWLPRKEILSTRQILVNILGHVDLEWRFTRIHDCANSPLHIPDLKDSDCSSSSSNDNYGTGTGTGTGTGIGTGTETSSTQSLSVILFLHEERECTSILDNSRYETELTVQTAWKFHHDVKQFSKIDSTVITSQKYYELGPDLPLWAVAQVHYGNEFLRFNILVKNFEKMKTFYETLIGKSCEVSRPGFCYFVLATHPGLEIHLSLKWLPNLTPRCITTAALRFKFRKLDTILSYLLSPPVHITPRLWQTEDPDGNVLLLEEIIQYHVGDRNRSKSRTAKDNLVFV